MLLNPHKFYKVNETKNLAFGHQLCLSVNSSFFLTDEHIQAYISHEKSSYEKKGENIPHCHGKYCFDKNVLVLSHHKTIISRWQGHFSEDKKCDHVFSLDPLVGANEHCSISNDGHFWYVEAKHGVMLEKDNSNEVVELEPQRKHLLSVGDTIRIGETNLKVQ